MFEVGQELWYVNVDERNDVGEINGYLFMAKCGDYIVAASEYAHCEGDFEAQLLEMFEESREECGVDVFLLKSELCFETYNLAVDCFSEMVDDNNN